jgi:hypothetical protein
MVYKHDACLNERLVVMVSDDFLPDGSHVALVCHQCGVDGRAKLDTAILQGNSKV